jgi:CheY-like chemotaxis protein
MADDNETTRYLIASMLGRLNHTIKAVEDGLQALQAAEAEDFDIVLMDMQMPVMDGLEAAREIRKLSGLRGQVPIIALTADAIPEHRPGFFAAGVNAVVVKPVVWRELGEQIDSLVGGAGVAAGMSRTPSRAELAEIADSVAGGQPVPAADPILNEAILDELSATLGVAAVTNMLPTFVTNMVDYRDRLARAVASGDLEEVKRAAHAMKGLAAQFGAPQVSAIARRIEQEATSIPDVAGVLGALGAAVAATAQAIRGRIERANTRSP